MDEKAQVLTHQIVQEICYSSQQTGQLLEEEYKDPQQYCHKHL